jgi:hypothetical protein
LQQCCHVGWLNNRQKTTQKPLKIQGSMDSMAVKTLASHTPQAKEVLEPIPLRLHIGVLPGLTACPSNSQWNCTIFAT